MFDLPDAKRVRRSEFIHDASSSPPPSVPDPVLEAQFHARLEELYGAPTFVPQVTGGEEGEPGTEPVMEEEVFEFRLFDGGAEDGAQKIVLRDEEDGTEGGFVRLKDPRQFVVGKAVGDRKIRIEQAAVSGEEILKQAKKRAWGLEVPWRVKVIKVVGKQKSGVHDGVTVGKPNGAGLTEEEAGQIRKKRPSKKRRILLRGRKRAKDEMTEKRRVEKESKEEAEREKRTRRNREKKVKRKLKEKAKKAGGANGIDSVNVGDNAEPGVKSPSVCD